MPCSRPRRQPLPHICPLCKKHFTTSGHLKRHVQIHSGERNFPCPVSGCETRCSRADNLQQHIKTHSASYVPRKAPKGTAKRTRPRNKAAGAERVRTRTVSIYSSAWSSSSSSSSPAFDDPSTWSSYSQSSAEHSPPPTTPPSFAFAPIAPLPTVRQPKSVQVPEIPGIPLLPLEPVELFRPKRLLVDASTFEAPTQPRLQFRPELHLELVHPIPRASQPRSPLLDLDAADSEDDDNDDPDNPVFVSPSIEADILATCDLQLAFREFLSPLDLSPNQDPAFQLQPELPTPPCHFDVDAATPSEPTLIDNVDFYTPDGSYSAWPPVYDNNAYLSSTPYPVAVAQLQSSNDNDCAVPVPSYNAISQHFAGC
ncbi:hypothetical protein C8F01DRAFT_361173 [Mycena amicta]|nr:hypothetical protein C8F01DRAFT_361173 [Mycena amicta]